MRRWLAPVLFMATGLQAQSLDLRVKPVTEGTVHSIRELHLSASGGTAPRPGTEPVGLPSDLDQGPLVGAVATRNFGRQPGEPKWQFGAAGTPEMQARMAQNGFEVVVKMDDGEQRVFRPRDAARFRVGQRVTVNAGELEPT